MPRTTNRKPPSPAAPVADAPGSETPGSPTGRDANGRFAKGNKGGPGNPFARQVAELRKQLVAAVTPEVMAQVCLALILRAQGGNLAAIKLLFSYVLGKPTETVNPDTLDHEEMEQYRRDLGMDELMGQVLLSMPADFACECVRTARPDILDRLIEKATGGTAPGAEAEDGEAAPSANGFNRGPQGDDPPAGDGGDAPMANGANGAEPAADREAGEDAPIANGGYRNRRANAEEAGPRQTPPRAEPGTGPARAMNPVPHRAAGSPATAPPLGKPPRCPRPGRPGTPPGGGSLPGGSGAGGGRPPAGP